MITSSNITYNKTPHNVELLLIKLILSVNNFVHSKCSQALKIQGITNGLGTKTLNLILQTC